jgi:Ca-activated chloride channel family protein
VAERSLPLEHAHAAVDATEGLARVVLRQRFANAHDLPLEITYSLPLPPEAAVSGFSFRIGDKLIVGQVDRKAEARERYEEALTRGHTAALVEQERDTLFTQSLGNVPPRTAIEAEIVLDLKLRYFEDGAFELRLPTTVAPRYLGGAGRVPDVERIAQDVAASPMPVRLTLDATIRGVVDGRIESTTHALAVGGREGAVTAAFREDRGVPLDRDVVLRWRAAKSEAVATARVSRRNGAASAYALVTIMPPLAAAARTPRDLILLLDTSGSMQGLPLEQAKRVAYALVSTLGDSDTLELIAFSSTPQRWKSAAVKMDGRGRGEALVWLSSLQAGGGTEMRDGILEALKSRRKGAQRQVVLVTDGLIGFETEIVRALLDQLPANTRVHTLGVGASVNRTLTSGAARAGHGIEVIADPDEDPERIAARIVARTYAPLVTDVRFTGDTLRSVAPMRLPDLFAGAPITFVAEVDPGGGAVAVTGSTPSGNFRVDVSIPRCAEGEGLAAIEQLFARERAADLEMRAAAGENIDRELEAVGLAHGIATRLTSWIAVSEEPTVDGTMPFKRERMPHELPYGTSAEAFGLRPPMAQVLYQAAAVAPAPMQASAGGFARPEPARGAAAFSPPPAPRSRSADAPTGAPPSPARPKSDERTLVSRLLKTFMPSKEDQGESEAKTMPKGGRAFRTVVVVRRDRELVIAVSVQSAFTWDAPATVTLVLTNGERRVAHVKKSPHAGALTIGTEIRIFLDVEGGTDGELQGVELADGTWFLIQA